MHNPPPLHLTDHLGPAACAIVFVLIMSLVKEPVRRNYNAIFAAGASGVYLSGGLGLWELLYTAVAGGVVAYLGLRSHRFIGLAWLMHAGWDLVHHFYGNAIWPFMPTSSFGCMISTPSSPSGFSPALLRFWRSRLARQIRVRSRRSPRPGRSTDARIEVRSISSR
jgi:hypothetical protein